LERCSQKKKKRRFEVELPSFDWIEDTMMRRMGSDIPLA